MNPEQQAQAQKKRDEDSIRQFDEDLRYLNWQISKIEVRLRRALEQVKTVDLPSLDTFQPFEGKEKTPETGGCSGELPSGSS